jgi:hypothetical protein
MVPNYLRIIIGVIHYTLMPYNYIYMRNGIYIYIQKCIYIYTHRSVKVPEKRWFYIPTTLLAAASGQYIPIHSHANCIAMNPLFHDVSYLKSTSSLFFSY